LVIQRRPAEALPVYRRAIAASAEPDAHIYAGLGAALDMVGKHDEARAAYAAGLRLAPQDFGLRNNLAISYALSGDTAKAKEILAGLSQNPASPPKVSESLSTLAVIEASLAHRMPARKRRMVAAAPPAARPAPVRAAVPASKRDVVEVTAPIHVARISRKANSDLPMAHTDNSEIYIRTARASGKIAEVRRRPAMSFRSDADTPDEAAAEVLALLEQAARGPRFVWQEAQRPVRE
jgi:tetratricopeptide (TPR) repeat protein